MFTAVLFGDLQPEALTAGLGSGRNAIYQALFEARRKLGARLAPGFPAAARTGARWLDAMLVADPGDTGCDLAFQALDKYAEADLASASPERRFPGVAVHLASCAPCHQDYQGLLAAGRRQAPASGEILVRAGDSEAVRGDVPAGGRLEEEQIGEVQEVVPGPSRPGPGGQHHENREHERAVRPQLPAGTSRRPVPG